MRLFLLLCSTLLLTSCAGYQRSMRSYSNMLEKKEFETAYQAIDGFSFLQNKRNLFLYFAEKGRLAQLSKQHDTSNYYLNLADNLLEDSKKSTADVIVSNVVNPMAEKYLAGDLERMMLHYCKAINYLEIGDQQGAVVEARRITLQANRLIDFNVKGTAQCLLFGYWIQGLLYEAAGDPNNAFIAYRNAMEQFQKLRNVTKKAPDYLLHDVVRMAMAAGFASEAELTVLKADSTLLIGTESNNGGQLVLLHEVGLAPRLENQFFNFNSWLPGQDEMYFGGRNGMDVYPVSYSSLGEYNNKVSTAWFKGLRLAVAIPIPTNAGQWSGSVQLEDGKQVRFEKISDAYQWASRPERVSAELQKAIVRAIVKKGIEIATQEAATSVAKASQNKNDDKKTNDKKVEAEAIGAGVGLLVNLLNQTTEVADTRSWRSSPGAIYMVRIPLKMGNNVITLQDGKQVRTLTVEGKKGVQIMKW